MKTEVTQKIVVVQSGWVFCGEVAPHPTDKDLLRVSDCYNIRVWGTSQGLGELALRGKQKATELDYYGVVTLPKSAVLAFIDCEVKIGK